MYNTSNFEMDQTCSSYQEYKSMQKELKLKYLIHSKYIKVLGEFIEVMYPGLKFDIFIRRRDPKVKKVDWYGETFMELKVFDIITLPTYNGINFEPYYRSRDYDGIISGNDIYEMIDSFIPEINKHLLISLIRVPNNQIPMNQMGDNMLEIPTFECWREYYIRNKYRQ